GPARPPRTDRRAQQRRPVAAHPYRGRVDHVGAERLAALIGGVPERGYVGNRITIVVPSPGAEWRMLMRPAWYSSTTRRASARPRPQPRRFVLSPGSNARDSSSRLMPRPLSRTEIST